MIGRGPQKLYAGVYSSKTRIAGRSSHKVAKCILPGVLLVEVFLFVAIPRKRIRANPDSVRRNPDMHDTTY